MKRAFAWLAGIVGIAALGKLLARRTHPAESSVDVPAVTDDDPAEELRRKLAGQRQPETPVESTPAEESLEERRARVHAKAREAIDSMGEDGDAA